MARLGAARWSSGTSSTPGEWGFACVTYGPCRQWLYSEASPGDLGLPVPLPQPGVATDPPCACPFSLVGTCWQGRQIVWKCFVNRTWLVDKRDGWYNP